MHYYLVAVTGHRLNLLTYTSETELAVLTQVKITVSKKELTGYIVGSCEAPEFACQPILSTTGAYLPESDLETVRFISGYYFCTLAETLALFHPFTSENSVITSYSIHYTKLYD